MPALTTSIIESAWTWLGGDTAALEQVHFVGEGSLASTFFLSDFAAATIAVAALSIGELAGADRGALPSVTVDRRLASMWFGWSIRPLGWALPAAWDPIAGDYRAKDGWIRLHTNAPHHRAAAQRVLNCQGDMDWRGADKPIPLPVQALDHATGYLVAAAAIRGLIRRRTTETGTLARLSLARTAKFLIDQGCGNSESTLLPESCLDLESAIEATEWGKARRLLPPVVVDNTPMGWSLPASGLGSAIARWED